MKFKRLSTIFRISILVSLMFVLFACGAKTIKINFDTLGGNSIESMEIKEIKDFILPTNPTKDGYQFDGWYLERECVNSFKTLNEDNEEITLYAKWIDNNEIIITFETTGGESLEPLKVDKRKLDEIYLPTELVRSGYLFTGWFIDQDFKTPFTKENLKGSNITLYAQWTKLTSDSIVITFDTMGAGTINKQVISQNSITSPTLPTNLTKNGYRFAGWYRDKECTIEFNYMKLIVELITSQNKEVTLYAKWNELIEGTAFEFENSSAFSLDVKRIDPTKDFKVEGVIKSHVVANTKNINTIKDFKLFLELKVNLTATNIDLMVELPKTEVTIGLYIENNILYLQIPQELLNIQTSVIKPNISINLETVYNTLMDKLLENYPTVKKIDLLNKPINEIEQEIDVILGIIHEAEVDFEYKNELNALLEILQSIIDVTKENDSYTFSITNESIHKLVDDLTKHILDNIDVYYSLAEKIMNSKKENTITKEQFQEIVKEESSSIKGLVDMMLINKAMFKITRDLENRIVDINVEYNQNIIEGTELKAILFTFDNNYKVISEVATIDFPSFASYLDLTDILLSYIPSI